MSRCRHLIQCSGAGCRDRGLRAIDFGQFGADALAVGLPGLR